MSSSITALKGFVNAIDRHTVFLQKYFQGFSTKIFSSNKTCCMLYVIT